MAGLEMTSQEKPHYDTLSFAEMTKTGFFRLFAGLSNLIGIIKAMKTLNNITSVKLFNKILIEFNS